MKQFFVKTQTANNPSLLHSLMKAEYSTEELADAKRVFDAEVEALAKSYKTIEQLDYCPSDKEQANAFYCSILAIDSEDPDEVEFIEDSEYFYE